MSTESRRPSPDALLARAAQEASTRGRLKIYFGYAAGVGKTYRMLQEAHRLAGEGVDLVVGYVEPHGRPETEALLAGLEVLPRLTVDYRGTQLQEFDLDAALARHPAVVLVDELAHTNPPGLRQAKRWQDIEELLDAGIDVHTTCNVQHVESLNDVIAQISGVTVRETVPDEVFDGAAELALVDLSPEDLLQRLSEGKVYVPAQAEQAMRHFFQRDNLVALRELALRDTAERVHAEVETARLGRADAGVWATRERLLVCISPSPTSAMVIRAARRLADSLGAEWLALHVETPAAAAAGPEDRARLLAHLQLAERLGAECVTISGADPVEETLRYAAQRNVTKLVVGKSPVRPWRRATITDRLLRQSGDLDVIVVHGAAAPDPSRSFWPRPAPRSADAWLAMLAILAAASVVAAGWHRLGFTEANLVMTYLAAVVLVAVRGGRGPAVIASILAVLLFDVLFTVPYFSVKVHDTQYLVTFTVMLTVGLVTAELTTRMRLQADLARRNERRTAALYQLARQLAVTASPEAVVGVAEQSLADAFGGPAAVFLVGRGALRPMLDHVASFASDPDEVAVAQWVVDHDRPAGRGTDTLPAAQALHVPLSSPSGVMGVVAIHHLDPAWLMLPEQRQQLDAYATQIAGALERIRLATESEAARLAASSEALRSNLLASVSHDLRTPLAVIAGTCSALADGRVTDPAERQELLGTVQDEAERLSRLVQNIMRLTQLTSAVTIDGDWHSVEDVVGSALRATERALAARPVAVDIRPELLLGWFDAVLVEQLLINLLDNACRYTPPDCPIALTAWRDGDLLHLRIADHGPGLGPDEAQRIFETFQRGDRAKADSRGAGLGLAICRAVAAAHGGTIAARNGPAGGAVFEVVLPQAEPPPSVAFLDEDPADE